MGKEELSMLNDMITQRISNNILRLLKVRGISQSSLLKAISQTETHTISPAQLSKALHNPKQYFISIPYLLQICDFFGVPLDTLVKTNLSEEDCIIKEDSEFNKLIETQNLIDEHKRLQVQLNQTEKGTDQSSVFITDPNNLLFSSFLQTYYCYFYPTVSSENKAPETMLTGTLALKANIDCCDVTFTIDTKKKKKTDTKFTKALLLFLLQHKVCILY